MDFIERIWGISLDGGSGTVEFLLFAIPMGLWLFHRHARLRANKSD